MRLAAPWLSYHSVWLTNLNESVLKRFHCKTTQYFKRCQLVLLWHATQYSPRHQTLIVLHGLVRLGSRKTHGQDSRNCHSCSKAGDKREGQNFLIPVLSEKKLHPQNLKHVTCTKHSWSLLYAEHISQHWSRGFVKLGLWRLSEAANTLVKWSFTPVW